MTVYVVFRPGHLSVPKGGADTSVRLFRGEVLAVCSTIAKAKDIRRRARTSAHIITLDVDAEPELRFAEKEE